MGRKETNMDKCKSLNCPRYARLEGYCNVHHPAKQREYRKKHPERFKEYSLKRDYGISMELYTRMMVEQKGACAICGALNGSERANNNGRKSLGVDHDHATGAVRGLLCQMCNQGIGAMQDNPKLLRKAVEYLENWKVREDKLSEDLSLKVLTFTKGG
jgi:Autographiviridae endonuclease VII